MFEHCGVFGVYSLDGKNVALRILAGLESLQHRGQESWGIAVSNNPLVKKMGVISQIDENTFTEIVKMEGSVGVGHIRYTTSSSSILKNAHPIEIGDTNKFYICHNGTLDRSLLSSYLKANGVSLQPSMTDTELLGWGLHLNLGKGLTGLPPSRTSTLT